MSKLSSQDLENMKNIYLALLEEMDVGGVVGGEDTSLDLENKDDYAPGDTRIPTLLGKTIQKRQGKINTKKKRLRKKV